MSGSYESREDLGGVASGFANIALWAFAILPGVALSVIFIFGTDSSTEATFLATTLPGGAKKYPPELLAIAAPNLYLWTLFCVRVLSAVLALILSKEDSIEEPPITSYMLDHFALRALLIYIALYLWWAFNFLHLQ